MRFWVQGTARKRRASRALYLGLLVRFLVLYWLNGLAGAQGLYRGAGEQELVQSIGDRRISGAQGLCKGAGEQELGSRTEVAAYRGSVGAPASKSLRSRTEIAGSLALIAESPALIAGMGADRGIGGANRGHGRRSQDGRR